MKWKMLSAAALLSGCSASLDEYRNQTPAFDLAGYFDGHVTAWGIVEDYKGHLTRHFCVEIVGSWQGNQGQLDETFYYDDGEIDTRLWTLTIEDNGWVTGSADDVIGIAGGRASGNAFNWQYRLEVPVEGDLYEFAVDDWMYRLDKHRLMNRSYLKKFGVTLAEVSIYFDKSDANQGCPAADQP